MRTFTWIRKTVAAPLALGLAGLIGVAPTADAQPSPATAAAAEPEAVEPGRAATTEAIWISPGFLTWHSAEPAGRELEGRNFGFGLDWQRSAEQRLSLGRFRNSDRQHTNYLAFSYQPITQGSWRFGLVVGVMDGYPNYRGGQPFPAILPLASLEQARWAIDTAFIPTISNRLYGGLSFKLRLRVN